MSNESTLAVWPLDGLTRVFPHDPPPRDAARRATKGWSLALAGGEYRTCQLGLRSSGPLPEVEIAAGTLRKGKHALPDDALKARWVGLVPVSQDSFDPGWAERPEHVPGWYPDPLLEAPPWGGSNPSQSAAVHLTLRIDRDTPPGVYRGTVVVKSGGAEVSVPLSVKVWSFNLPAKPNFYVTNWFQLDCITKWHRCEAWSKRHWELLELYAAEMAAHRQNVITTPTIMGNFHNSDPMTLVRVVRRKKGGYRFDFKRLGRWVELFDRHGFELYEMWHLASQATGATAPPFGVYDEATGKEVWYESMETDSDEYRELVAAFLSAISRWLDKRGLTDRFLLHVFDEPRRENWPRYAELSAFFREHAPGLRHIDAISTSDLITDYGAEIEVPVPLTPHLADDEYYQRRAQAGQEEVWWYTCCGPGGRFANRFVGMPLINTCMLHWQSFVYGISGYLHWGYNFWHRTKQNASGWPGINNYADHTLLNPYREHPWHWATGDACIVYPAPQWWEDAGPVSSLRYEAMREGLQDYEMLRMLDEIVRTANPKRGSKKAKALAQAKRLLARVRGPVAGSLTEFTRDADRLLRERRRLGECLAHLQ